MNKDTCLNGFKAIGRYKAETENEKLNAILVTAVFILLNNSLGFLDTQNIITGVRVANWVQTY